MHYLRWRRDMLLHWRSVARLLPRGGEIVEVGTWRGASAKRWLRRAPTRLVLVDAWETKEDESWEGQATQSDLDGIYWSVYAMFMHERRSGQVEIIRQDSIQASRVFTDNRYDVAYIDGDHSFEACRADLSHWWPKVKPGGWMVLDDHLPGRWWADGVIEAAKDFQPQDCSRRVVRGRWLCLQKSS